MPRFHFHTQADRRYTDTEGAEYPTYVEARREAIRTCGMMMQDAREDFLRSWPWCVSVTDGVGLVLWEIYVDGQSTTAGRSPDNSPG